MTAAAKALGKVANKGDSQAIAAVSKLLKDDERNVREAAAEAAAETKKTCRSYFLNLA